MIDRVKICHNDKSIEIFRPDVEEVLKGGKCMNKVKMYRTGANITQERMAEVLGCSVNTYRSLEDNPSKFNVEQIKKYMAEINKYDVNATANDIFLLSNCTMSA